MTGVLMFGGASLADATAPAAVPAAADVDDDDDDDSDKTGLWGLLGLLGLAGLAGLKRREPEHRGSASTSFTVEPQDPGLRRPPDTGTTPPLS